LKSRTNGFGFHRTKKPARSAQPVQSKQAHRE